MDSAAILEAIEKAKEETFSKLDSKLEPVTADLKVITTCLAKFNTELTEVQTRVSSNEDDIILLKKQIAALQKDNAHLLDRAEDAENRSRRNNLRFTSVPQKFDEPRELAQFVERMIQQLFGAENFPTAPVVERAHRTLANDDPSKPPRRSPPTILAKFLNFQDKVKIMRLARDKTLTYDGATIQIFPDFSQAVSKRRQKFSAVKKHLRSLKKEYSMIFPATLRVMVEGEPMLFESAEEAERFFSVPSTPGTARRRLFRAGRQGGVVPESPLVLGGANNIYTSTTARSQDGARSSKFFTSHLSLPFPSNDLLVANEDGMTTG